MKIIKNSFITLLPTFIFFLFSSISYGNFKAPSPTVDYTIVFRILDPDGEPIDINLVGYSIEGEYTYLNAKAGEEALRRYGDENLLHIERIDEEMVFKFKENSKLRYLFFADFDDYMFSLNGEITPQQLKKNGKKDYIVELRLDKQNKLEVTSTVDGKFYEKSTVMFSPLNPPQNNNIERNLSAIGIINPNTKTKVVYLSSGTYIPILSAEDERELIIYEGWKFEANKNTPKILKFNKKKENCVLNTITLEEKLAQKPYFRISFYNGNFRYSYFGEWNRSKINVYLPNKNIDDKGFGLSDYPESFYSNSINYDFEKSLALGDLYYANGIETLENGENKYIFKIKSKDLKGNLHERLTLFDFDVYKINGLDEHSKKLKIKNLDTRFWFENPEIIDYRKTYNFILYNCKDSLYYGQTVFKLKFVNKKPIFTFVSLSKPNAHKISH